MTALDSSRFSSPPQGGVSEILVPANEPYVSARLDPTPPNDQGVALPRRGLMDRDWQKVLVVFLTVLAGLALTWVLWQVLSPISHTLILFGLAAVLAFALSSPVKMLTARIGNRLVAIVAVYLLVGTVVVGGLTLLAGPFVRDATALSGALPQYAADLQARAPEVQSTLGNYGIQADLDQLKARAAAAVEQGGSEVLKNLVGTLAEVGGIILDIVLALVISLYLLIDGPRFRVRISALVPSQHRAKALFLEAMTFVLGEELDPEGKVGGSCFARAGWLPAWAAHARADHRRGCRRRDWVTRLAVRGGAGRAGRAVRVGADVRPDTVGGAGGDRCVVHAVPHSRVGHPVLSRHSASRKQRPGAAYQRACRRASSAGRNVPLLAGFQLAGLLGGLFAVPLAGVLWVLMGAAYRNAVAVPPPPRRWGLPRWQRGMPLPARAAVETMDQPEVPYEHDQR
jgi:predicted PurR-regulated permease PerM